MSTSDKVSVAIDAPPFVEVSAIDREFQLAAWEMGSCKLSLDPGIYELKFRVGEEAKSELITARAGESLKLKAPQLAFSIPTEALLEDPNSIVVEPAPGSKAQKYRVGLEGASNSTVPVRSRRTIALDARASSSIVTLSGTDGDFARSIFHPRGWSTHVLIALPKEDGGAQDALASATVVLHKKKASRATSPFLEMTKAARWALDHGESLPTWSAAWRELDGSEAPLAILYAVHARLASARRREESLAADDRAQLRALVEKLPEELQKLPDAIALRIALEMGDDTTALDTPPMLAASWSILVDAAARRPALIAAASHAARVARSIRIARAPLIWALGEENNRAAYDHVLIGDSNAASKATPTNLPGWVVRGTGSTIERDPARLSRLLALPPSAAIEAAHDAERRSASAKLAAFEDRKKLLRSGKPWCLIAVPSGIREDPIGGPPLDFAEVSSTLLEPAAIAAGFAPVLLDELDDEVDVETAGARTEAFELLIADLTLGEPSIMMELGAFLSSARPAVSIGARRRPRPDRAPEAQFQYDLTELRISPAGLGSHVDRLAGILQAIRTKKSRSKRVELERASIRKNISTRLEIHRLLQLPREESVPALKALVASGMRRMSSSSLLEIFFAYRAIGDVAAMIELFESARRLQRRRVAREQYAWALNRMAAKKSSAELWTKAIAVLTALIDEYGPSNEACGMMGRAYKDAWEEAAKKGSSEEASAHLEQSVAHYKRGYLASPEDPYSGINALTMLELVDSREAAREQQELLPVVRFAVERRIQPAGAGYWDLSTQVELDVLQGQRGAAERHLSRTIAAAREDWQLATTARNLKLIAGARRSRRQDVGWIDAIIRKFEARESELAASKKAFAKR